MSVVELIERKRDGGSLSAGEWRDLMARYASGEVPDYQIAALAMAVFFRGMESGETEGLMLAMLDSGRKLDLGHLGVPRIDKHSTGGVGDKVSLILAPLVAACGVAVPMMSGRGLGHTGGTLDKLESIPGFRTRLSLTETARQIEKLGCALIGQTDEIAPADRRFYSLRDATATVESIPLIAASIMSKKLAEGLTGLVLDVKTGAGAFMPALDDGIQLAQTMISLGEGYGCPTVALITDMDSPLGYACGNALEVAESVRLMRGDNADQVRGGGTDLGHQEIRSDLREVTLALAVEMLLLSGVAGTPAEGRKLAERTLASGAALGKFREIVEAQGGDPGVVDDPDGVLPRAPVVVDYRAVQSGVVQRVEPRVIGRAITALGGGRSSVEDEIDPAVGFEIFIRPGDRVAAGDVAARIHAGSSESAGRAGHDLARAISIGEDVPIARPLISHRISSRGVVEHPVFGAS